MPDSLGTVLERYTRESKRALVAKASGISEGLLSQLLNNKTQLSNRVIEKISQTLSNGDSALKDKIKRELQNTGQVLSSRPTNDPLVGFERFFDTDSNPNAHRLMCITYRDMLQSTSKGKYPGLIDMGAEAIRKGLACAMFQSFGPVDDIKENLFEAVKRDDIELSERWTYINRLVTDVREVYKSLKEKSEGTDPECRGTVMLYEAADLDPLTTCEVNSRLFYSQEHIGGQNKVRVAQLVAGIDDVHYIECDPMAVNQFAVAAQFYPIPRYWRENDYHLPATEGELESAYETDNEKRRWKLYTCALQSSE